MADLPGTINFTLPRARAAELLSMLDKYAAGLTDSPDAWMDDDEIDQRDTDARAAREMHTLLRQQLR